MQLNSRIPYPPRKQLGGRRVLVLSKKKHLIVIGFSLYQSSCDPESFVLEFLNEGALYLRGGEGVVHPRTLLPQCSLSHPGPSRLL